MKNLTLPTKHLSYSQLSLWHEDKGAYWNRYFRGIKPPPNIWMAFGDRFARAIEAVAKDGELPEDAPERMDEVLPQLSILDIAEHHAVFHSPAGWSVQGYFDTYSPGKVIDYKTGGKEWTQERAEDHKQLHLYALMHHQQTGKYPVVGIEWCETLTDLPANHVELTGRVEKFYYQATPQQCAQALEWANDTAHDISRHYEAWIGKDFDDYIFQQYAKAQEQLAHWKAVEKQLKAEYTELMQNAGLSRYEVAGGNFSTYLKKSWKYHPDVDAHIKDIQAQAREEGQAEEVEKTIFMYRKNKKA